MNQVGSTRPAKAGTQPVKAGTGKIRAGTGKISVESVPAPAVPQRAPLFSFGGKKQPEPEEDPEETPKKPSPFAFGRKQPTTQELGAWMGLLSMRESSAVNPEFLSRHTGFTSSSPFPCMVPVPRVVEIHVTLLA